MPTALEGVSISPVNMGDRKNLGIRAGDTVRVHQKIVDEKGKARMQVFEGIVLARKHGAEAGATFTVRRVVDGVGVEKIFPLYSPLIDKIELVRRSKVRRAKLYYIREKVAREIKRQMRKMHLMDRATESETEVAARVAEEETKRVEEEAVQKAEEEAKAAEEAKKAEEAAPAEVVEQTPIVGDSAEEQKEEPAPEGDKEKKE